MGKNRIKNHKTAAKAMGLKSTFILDDENVFITSFGKGFDADPEKTVQRDEIINHKNTFSVQKKSSADEKGQKLEMHGRTIVKPVSMYKDGTTKNSKTTNKTVVDIPTKDSNMLHAKDIIEKMYFGETFDDNIHIQIAYNIMDIKKIFSLYANIVVNSVNNINRDKLDEDFLGYVFKTQNTYEASKLAYELHQLGAFTVERGRFVPADDLEEKLSNLDKEKYPTISQILDESKDKISNTFKLSREIKAKNISVNFFDKIAINHENFLDFANYMKHNALYFPNLFYTNERFDMKKAYEIFRILGNLRQGSFHEINSSKSWILTIDKNTDERLKDTVNNIFDTKLNKINSEFVETSKKNLLILKMLYPNNKNIVQQYYDFAVRKAYKNLGFSIKDIRETILTFDDAKHLNEQKFDSVRGKLFTLFDFVIYDYFINNIEISQGLVNELRATMSEDEKRSIYVKYANDVWSQIKNFILNTVVKKLNSNEIKNLKGNISDSKLLDEIQKPEDISLFAKTIYCISMFLDGKEINMFLSSLINKFENIASLVETLSYNKIPLNLNEDYFIFENSSKYANDLAFVKSIAKMGKTKKAIKQGDEKAKSSVYYDSAALFGEFDEKRISIAISVAKW